MKIILPLIFGWSFLLLPGLRAGTVAYWRFEDTEVSEVSPEEFLLELSPTVEFPEDVPGAKILDDGQERVNRYSYSNGRSEEGTRFPASEILDELMGRESFTIEGFLKLADGAAKEKYMRIIGNSYYQGSSGGWAIGISSGKLRFSARQRLGASESSSGGILTSMAVFSENKWHHFAVVGYRSPKQLVVRLFVDGEESVVEHRVNYYPESPGGEAIVPNPDPILIATKNIFLGSLDEIRISDFALDPTEFLQAQP